MRMRLFCACLILSSFFSLSSFAQKGKMTAIDYNDKLAAITDSLYNMGVAWGTEFQEIYSADKDFTRLGVHRKKILAFTTRKIAEVRNGPTAGKGAADLKNSMLQFLTFEKEMIEKAFVPMEQLNGNSSQTEIDEAIKNLTAEAAKEEAMLKAVNEAQEKFGALNNFSLEEQEEE